MAAIGQAYTAQLATLILLVGVIAIAGVVSWATERSRSRTTRKHPWGQNAIWGGQHYTHTPPRAARHYYGYQPNTVQWVRTQHTPLWPSALVGVPKWPSPVASNSRLSATPPTPPELDSKAPEPAPCRLQQRRRLSRRGASSIHH